MLVTLKEKRPRSLIGHVSRGGVLFFVRPKSSGASVCPQGVAFPRRASSCPLGCRGQFSLQRRYVARSVELVYPAGEVTALWKVTLL